jgi:high-affinity iron transporter
MLASAVIVFREVLEAALIAGIMLAATRGVDRSRAWIAAGVAGGVAGALMLAASADALSQAAAGMGQELFNALILLVAVAMLAWHTVWMGRHGREIATEMKAVGHAVSMGTRPLSVLAVVVGVAVLREGAETVLFLFGITAAGDSGVDTALGCGAGLVAGIGVGALLYAGLLAIPTRHLFAVTTWMVTLLAAGMAAQAVNYLAAAGILDFAADPLWDTSRLLSEDSIPGRLLHTLVGYVDRPSAAQLAAYAATLVGITALTRALAPPSPNASS